MHYLMWALILVESHWNPQAMSPRELDKRERIYGDIRVATRKMKDLRLELDNLRKATIEEKLTIHQEVEAITRSGHRLKDYE